MASAPPQSNATSQQLMTLGMFIFGMDTIAYQEFERSREWRHELSERHGARDAAQFIGPGPESITIGGLVVPELGGSYAAIETLADMADAGEDYPLMDGQGRILGHYRILRIEEGHLTIMAGGIPRHVDFRIELERAEDRRDDEQAISV